MSSRDQIDQLYNRAKAGSDGGLNMKECKVLKDHLTGRTLPSYCQDLLAKARRSGTLARRSTSVSRAWDFAEGHGKRTLYEETSVPGGMYDKPSDSKSTAEIYLQSKDPTTQAKIRRQVVRMASQGAAPRIPANEKEVKIERERQLQRRLTRRKSIAQQNRAKHANPVVFAASSVVQTPPSDNFAAHVAANWLW